MACCPEPPKVLCYRTIRTPLDMAECLEEYKAAMKAHEKLVRDLSGS